AGWRAGSGPRHRGAERRGRPGGGRDGGLLGGGGCDRPARARLGGRGRQAGRAGGLSALASRSGLLAAPSSLLYSALMSPTTGFLERIAADRRRRIAEQSARLPGYALRDRLPPTRPAGRLERGLRRPAKGPLRLICEIKRASPSQGLLKPDLDPVDMA